MPHASLAVPPPPVAAAALVVVVAVVGLGTPTSADEIWDYRSVPIYGNYTPLVGNFGGDHATDVFWYAAGTTADSLWLGREGVRGGFAKVPMTVDGGFFPVVGDLGGDNYDDIFWYRPGSGSDPLWISVDSPAVFDKSRTLSVYGTYSPLSLTDYRFAPGQDFKDDIFFYAAGTTPTPSGTSPTARPAPTPPSPRR